MDSKKYKVLLTFRIGGENGGPYTSHKRILESSLSDKYHIQPWMIPNPRQMRKPKIFFELIKYLKTEKPDLVHLAGLQSEGFLITLACRLARIKTVVAIHGSSTEAISYSKISQLIFKKIEAYTVRKANAVYGVCNYVSSWGICKKSKKYYGTIYNMIESHPVKSESNLRNELGLLQEDIIVASTGRITKDKGFDIMWEVIKRFKENANVKFVIAGDGAYKDQLKKDIELEEMQDKVFLLGYRNDIDNILNSADIFMLCTKHENHSMSLLEAGYHSLPIVASDVGGIPEIIENTISGYLIPVGDVDGFELALKQLIQDDLMRKAMGRVAKKKIEEKFNQENIVEKLDEIYHKVFEA